MLQIGSHLSASKGYLAMGKQAVKLGATTFAFFTRNPRGGSAKAIQEQDVAAFLTYAQEHQIQKIVAHAPYTLNLCWQIPLFGNLPKTHWRMIWYEWSIRRISFIIFIRAVM